jgi:Flp pilus assembly protein TadG
MLDRLRPVLGHVLANRRGNVAMIAAFALIPLVFAAGMAVDYTMATRRQDQINGFADAAALAAVTPSMMLQSQSTAQTTAYNMFVTQLATVGGVTYTAGNINVAVSQSTTGSKVTRSAVVTYSASSANAFAGVLGINTSTISGSSTASSANSPKTSFYLLVDTSPSMEIAATTAGISTMVSNTSSQGGCAFGCHESHPQSDNLGNPGGEDNYQLARNLGVTLRIDLVTSAANNLMSTAYSTANQNNTTYQASIYTMDYSLNKILALTTLNSSSAVSRAQAAANTIAPLQVYDNNCLTKTTCNRDEDSYLDAGVSGLNSILPAPGDGMGSDAPQEVLMIVSDAVIDEDNGSGRVYDPINTLVDNCTAIKNRGVRIAFLYLTYNPLPTNAWYNTYIAPFQSQIAPAAQACASPGLFFQVNTDGDVSSALSALFQKAVATARLTQ